MYLEFLNIKFSNKFLDTLIFFIKSEKFILSLKNILILFLPKFFLKKIMWFS